MNQLPHAQSWEVGVSDHVWMLHTFNCLQNYSQQELGYRSGNYISLELWFGISGPRTRVDTNGPTINICCMGRCMKDGGKKTNIGGHTSYWARSSPTWLISSLNSKIIYDLIFADKEGIESIIPKPKRIWEIGKTRIWVQSYQFLVVLYIVSFNISLNLK